MGGYFFALPFVNKGYKHMKNRIAAGIVPESNAVFDVSGEMDNPVQGSPYLSPSIYFQQPLR